MKIRFGYTPDTDDAFHYHALESGKIKPDFEADFEFEHHHIQTLNEMALRGELQVSAISSILYPKISQEYVILSAGSSVGRGYGPVLAVPQNSSLQNLEGKTVAVPGEFTTGYFLLNLFYQGFKPIFMEFDQVAGAIQSGRADAGVLIHEELVNYKFKSMQKMCCLGEKWFEETGRPLPVGLTVARRDLGDEIISKLRHLLQESMRYAMQNDQEVFESILTFSSGRKDVSREFVDKFANEDTENMPLDVREGLAELFHRAYERGLIETEPKLEIF